jgi:hypothetical protein
VLDAALKLAGVSTRGGGNPRCGNRGGAHRAAGTQRHHHRQHSLRHHSDARQGPAHAAALVSALDNVEHDPARRRAVVTASSVDAVTMVEFASVYVQTAADMAAVVEATAASRTYGRLDYDDMRAEALAASTGRRRGRGK